MERRAGEERAHGVQLLPYFRALELITKFDNIWTRPLFGPFPCGKCLKFKAKALIVKFAIKFVGTSVDEPTLTRAAAELPHGGGGRGYDGPGSKHPAPAHSSQDGAGHRGGGES